MDSQADRVNRAFEQFASWIDRKTSQPVAFALACVVVIAWFICGFFVGFTDTFYQLLINTGTTIVTFLMVFLLQNSQTRSAERDRQAADRDADVNKRSFDVLQIVQDHVEESRKLHAAMLSIVQRIDAEERQELEMLKNEGDNA